MKYTIKKNEIGFLFKKGLYLKTLDCGLHTLFSKVYDVIIVDKKHWIENYNIDLKQIYHDEKIKSALNVIKVSDQEVVFVFMDGIFENILHAGIYSFFKEPYDFEFIHLDLSSIEITPIINEGILNSPKFNRLNNGLVTKIIVKDGFVGALYVNGAFKQILVPGNYYFLTLVNTINVKMVNTKIQTIAITGQELLTLDKVNLRTNFTVTLKIIDCLKTVMEFSDFNEQLYVLLQFAIREYISTKTLDELLTNKNEIGTTILNDLKEKEGAYGVEFISAGIKDIILPGEIKDILNTVLIAEKKALANVITRREETASTRSLLNTAKLMDENVTLYRLKELEYLEKICDKVGNISVSNNGSIIEQLTQLVSQKISK